ncbi:transcription activator glk1 [Phtheirospermum japonicum]|uniref:Transcription activator glk1 n=1 Tax=Phtheirospermum japonicum TaxID=374723 RepID=A0A830BJ57_9LAMI|nr:transcription activator glk1 [Phtheirospermum japonicum]
MMTSPPELISFDRKPYNCSMFLKSLGEHTIEQTHHLEAYLARLEEERLKIDSFKREFPICTQLLTHAMERSRQELQSQRTNQSESPMIQFIPLKNATEINNGADKSGDRANWMASARIWNHDTQETDMTAKQRINYDDEIISRRSDNNSDHESRGNDLVAEKYHKNTSRRKARRCWSPDLHRRFVDALHMLGGSQATPKQIRELMKVEGLTNDEVKSHLQKYRLHTRTPIISPSQQAAGGPRLVVLGSIWVPSEYTAHGGSTVAALYGSTCSRLS